MLRKEDISVLEHALNFCPSLKHHNKDSLKDSFYWFIRCLELCKYFFNSSDTTEINTDDILDPDQCPSKWSKSNLCWYPHDVKEGCYEGLQTSIKYILSNTCNALQINENEIKNNLSKKEKGLLNLLANDKNIVIKPNDKWGEIVVMNTDDYEKACLDILTNTEYYEELSYDPNDQYKQSIRKEMDKMWQMDCITDLEHFTLNDGSCTPLYDGLPKLHKVFTLFPYFQPIYSGSNSCTNRLSEWIDSFLKAAAQKLLMFKTLPHSSIKWKNWNVKEMYW